MSLLLELLCKNNVKEENHETQISFWTLFAELFKYSLVWNNGSNLEGNTVSVLIWNVGSDVGSVCDLATKILRATTIQKYYMENGLWADTLST